MDDYHEAMRETWETHGGPMEEPWPSSESSWVAYGPAL